MEAIFLGCTCVALSIIIVIEDKKKRMRYKIGGKFQPLSLTTDDDCLGRDEVHDGRSYCVGPGTRLSLFLPLSDSHRITRRCH